MCEPRAQAGTSACFPGIGRAFSIPRTDRQDPPQVRRDGGPSRCPANGARRGLPTRYDADNIPHIPWSDEERDTLRRLRENGVSVRQCAEMLGRSFHSVQRAMRRLGIERPAQQRTAAASRATAPRGAGVAAAAAVAEA